MHPRIGIFGAGDDPQCEAVSIALRNLGAEPVLVPADAFESGLTAGFEDDATFFAGQRVDDVRAFYVRYIPAAYAPYLEEDAELVLYEDWFTRYMHTRERASFFVSWLLKLHDEGALLMNPPQAGSVLQYKPFQLHALRKLGAKVPRTLITNDAARVRAFAQDAGEVIFKPLMGGALTRALDQDALRELDALVHSPVIFQERVYGEDVRVVVVDEAVVSSVAIVTPEQHLDFRADPVYAAGNARYREVELPSDVQRFCVEAARACGLHLAGIDLKHDGQAWVFLELNSSPVYLDVERKCGHRISDAIARALCARQP